MAFVAKITEIHPLGKTDVAVAYVTTDLEVSHNRVFVGRNEFNEEDHVVLITRKVTTCNPMDPTSDGQLEALPKSCQGLAVGTDVTKLLSLRLKDATEEEKEDEQLEAALQSIGEAKVTIYKMLKHKAITYGWNNRSQDVLTNDAGDDDDDVAQECAKEYDIVNVLKRAFCGRDTKEYNVKMWAYPAHSSHQLYGVDIEVTGAEDGQRAAELEQCIDDWVVFKSRVVYANERLFQRYRTVAGIREFLDECYVQDPEVVGLEVVREDNNETIYVYRR